MLDDLYGCTVPDNIRELAIRHQQHVLKLVFQLESSGLSDTLIESSVDQLISSYRVELMDAVKQTKAFYRA